MTPADDGTAVPAGGPADADAAAEAVSRLRAAQLLLWYPRPWRDRYGEEFTELLVSDIAERPRSLGRTLDVAKGGLLARLAGAGLTGAAPAVPPGDPAAARGRHVAASLGTLGAASAVFLIVGAAQWSQLLIGWVWVARRQQPGAAVPLLAADRNATLGTSAAIIALLALGVFAALPVLVTVAARLAGPGTAAQRIRLAVPAVTLVAALTALVIGGRSLENNWIGTGGLHSPVPGGLAAFIWAVTLFVSAYWAHPGVLSAFPGAELAWMELSPLLLAVAVASAVILVRRTGLSPRLARFEARLGLACCIVMTAFLALCAAWLTADGPLAGGTALFHAGWVNVASTVILSLTLTTAVAASRTARRTLASPRR
ncbi:hypothetical protein EAS64_18625 [Trebonia kvetii]|uniref:Uncharacterized protein n=1 Tax=Trebonia kvetii TaxID=2480626 RepID=A0A6P2C4E2_9ACTN|nr:hypothetical protein [Trebonia kvetii]TVZ04383.1 hypothetical protein EAS64_18625 [Trebonia kvetii]